MHSINLRPLWLAPVFLVLVLASVGALANELDTSEISEQDTLLVITTDADGDMRETKIWVVVLDGISYIRTYQGTTWGDNVEGDRK